MNCQAAKCDCGGAPATHLSTDPIGGGTIPVCSRMAEVLARLDEESRAMYRQLGDPRADRPRLVVPIEA